MTYPGGPYGEAGEVVTYTYNAAGALQSVVGADPYLQNAAYDATGRTEALTLTANLQLDYGHYPWTQNGGRLQFLKAGSPTNLTALQYLNYTYDAAGNVLSLTNFKSGESQAFTYGATGNLLSAGNTTYAYNDSRPQVRGQNAQHRRQLHL